MEYWIMVHGGSLNLSPSSGCEHEPEALPQHGVPLAGLQPCSVWCEPVRTRELSRCQARLGLRWGDSHEQESGEGDPIPQWQAVCRAQTTCLPGLHSGGLVLPKVLCQRETHRGPEKGGRIRGSVGTAGLGGNQSALIHPGHRASLSPPVGPLRGTDLPPIKMGNHAARFYRRSINK